MLKEYKFSKFFSEKVDYKNDTLKLLPKNTAYLIVQMTPNMDYMYIGYLHINQDNKKNYIVNRFSMEPSLLDQMRKLLERYNQMRSALAKTPLMTAQDEKRLEEEHEKAYNEKMLPEFLNMFDFLNNFLEGLINPEIVKEEQNPEQEINTANTKGAKTAAAPTGKKIDKNE